MKRRLLIIAPIVVLTFALGDAPTDDCRAQTPLPAAAAQADAHWAALASDEPARVQATLDQLADNPETTRAMIDRRAAFHEHRPTPETQRAVGALLRHSDARVRRIALAILIRGRADAFDQLAMALKSRDPNLLADAALRSEILQTIKLIRNGRAEFILLDAVNDPQSDIRIAALDRLASDGHDVLPATQWTAVALKALDDPDPEMRFRAANQFRFSHFVLEPGGEFDKLLVVRPLIKALQDSSPPVRAAALTALGGWESDEAIEPLRPFLKDKDIKGEAAWALARLGDRESLPAIRAMLPDHDPQIVRALGRFKDQESLDAMAALVNDARVPQDVRIAAIEFIVKLKSRAAVPVLIKALESDNLEIARRACGALGGMRDPRAVAPLIAAIDRPWARQPPRRRPRASDNPVVWPLVRLGWCSLGPLADALDAESPATREVAASAICRMIARAVSGENMDYDDSCVLDAADFELARPALVRLLQDDSAEVRTCAILALANLGDTHAAQAVRALFDEGLPSYFERELNYASPAAAKLLRQGVSTDRLVGYLADGDSDKATVAVQLLGLERQSHEAGAWPKRLLGQVYLLRNDNDADDPWSAFRDSPAVDQLLEQLATAQRPRSREITQALGRIGDRRAIEPLAAIATKQDEEDQYVRVEAALALVDLQDPRGLELVAKWLSADTQRVRQLMLFRISERDAVNEALVPLLIKSLDDPSLFLRVRAAKSLGMTRSADARKALIARLPDSHLSWAIIGPLTAAGEKDVFPEMAKRLDDDNEWIRALAARALERAEDHQYVDNLIASLKDPAPVVRIAAIASLTSLQATEAVPEFTAALNDPDPQVAHYAARGIKRPKP